MTGIQLKEWRESRGLSKSELARELGVARSTVIDNERSPKISKRLDEKIRECRLKQAISDVQKGLTELLSVNQNDEDLDNADAN